MQPQPTRCECLCVYQQADVTLLLLCRVPVTPTQSRSTGSPNNLVDSSHAQQHACRRAHQATEQTAENRQ